MAGLDPEPDIANLFCHYNDLYFRDSLGACAVSWAEEPLPYGTFSSCDYYPGGGGCIVLLSKSLYECHPESDLKNVLLHEMIHAYMCVKDNNTNHSDHGGNFQKLMNTINSSSLPDAHRPIGGYGIIMKHDIRNKYHQYRCESCGDLVKSTKIRGPSPDDCIERMAANNSCLNSMCQWHSCISACTDENNIVSMHKGYNKWKGPAAVAQQQLGTIVGLGKDVVSRHAMDQEDNAHILCLEIIPCSRWTSSRRRGTTSFSSPRTSTTAARPTISKKIHQEILDQHEKQCSGSYYPVRESPTGRLRLKGPIASSAEETLDERKADESASGSWHAKHTSSKWGTRNKHEREDTSAKFLHPTDDAIDNSKRLGSSSGGRSSKKIKLSKDIGFDHLTATPSKQPPKRPRTEAINKNEGCIRQNKRKVSKWDGSYSVLIERMNYYFVDNSDEDEVPLINKRTERRKQQKLLQSSQATESNNGFGGTTSSSCSQGTGDDNRSEIVPASQVDERLLPHHPVSNHVAAADQSGRGTVSATSDSPMVGDIVVILDG